MQQEDIAAAFIAIVTLVLNLIPSITGAGILSTEQSAALLSLAVILKAVLGDLSKKTTVYTITGTDPQQHPYTGSTTITTPDTIAAAIQRLTMMGFTNLTYEEHVSPG